MTRCGLCQYPVKLISAVAGGDRYTLNACMTCGVLHLLDPAPKDMDYYVSGQYRLEVPRTEADVSLARNADRCNVPGLLAKLRQEKPYERQAGRACWWLDMCSEDNSVEESGITGSMRVAHWYPGGVPIETISENAYLVVSCFLSLEHVTDPLRIIGAARRACVPGGVFIASVPAVTCKNPDLKPHHTWYYCGHSLYTAFRIAGFKSCTGFRSHGYQYVAAQNR